MTGSTTPVRRVPAPAGEADLVTTAVVGGYLESTCREMGLALTRNAISPIFIEGQDFSCAILDPDRELIAAANFDPSHLCSMAYAADWAVLDLGADAIGSGDIIICNDPYRGGTHLPDVTMFSPVVVDGQLVAYVVTRAHHLDVGGMAPGSIPSGARDVAAEGIRIPPLKWQEAGEENPDVVEMILANVRLPDVQLSDFRAQAASLRTGEERLRQLCARYGAATVLDAMRRLKDQAEAMMRSFIASIPDGTYSFTDYMDGDGNTSYRYAIHVEVTIEGDSATVDFRGTSKQAEGAINLPFAMTASAVFNAFLQLAGKEIPFNHGCFRPIRFRAPRGSIVNAQPLAPVFGCTTDTPLRVIDAITGALADAVPDRVIAGSYGTCNCLAGSGTGPDGEPFLFWFFYEGGWGAAAWRDGWNATPNQSANFRDYPVEIIESVYPLRCERVGLLPNSGGPGRFRGGLGTVHEFTFLSRTVLSGFGDRHEIRPYGLRGGRPGAGSRFLIRRAGTNAWVGIETVAGNPSKFSGLVMEAGESIMVVNGGGGGYGDPRTRDREALTRDVREGLVSVEAAATEYGITVDVTPDEASGPRIDTLPPPGPALSCQSSPREIGQVRPPAPADEFAQRARTVLDEIEAGYCRSRCPLGADPKRCPYYHAEALEFWPVAALKRWTVRNCPIGDRLLARVGW
ncbi:MAG TPA: hydantoinase B/oxoprolinase family protein [Actinomycetota bacterium]|nr:hydantoinase B/oxoprolinase family protein [Actinomycetota bacterium]